MQVSSLEGHRIWSGTYDESPNPLLALETRVLSERLGGLGGLRIADVACGTGRWMIAAHCQGAQVVGVDSCAEMLEVAAAKPGLNGKLVVGEAEQIPLVSGFADLVLCSFAVNYFRSAPSAIAKMARITCRGGRVVISDLHPVAAIAGWKRAFRVGGSSYEIDHESWNIRRLNLRASRCELAMEWQIDAAFGVPERKIFRKAGKTFEFAAARSIPAIRIVSWKKL